MPPSTGKGTDQKRNREKKKRIRKSVGHASIDRDYGVETGTAEVAMVVWRRSACPVQLAKRGRGKKREKKKGKLCNDHITGYRGWSGDYYPLALGREQQSILLPNANLVWGWGDYAIVWAGRRFERLIWLPTILSLSLSYSSLMWWFLLLFIIIIWNDPDCWCQHDTGLRGGEERRDDDS